MFVGKEFIQSVAAISNRWAEGDGSEQKLTKGKKGARCKIDFISLTFCQFHTIHYRKTNSSGVIPDKKMFKLLSKSVPKTGTHLKLQKLFLTQISVYRH